MSAEAISKPQVPAGESKSARKKKGKAEAVASSVHASASVKSSQEPSADVSVGEGKVNGHDAAAFENSYIKELQKNLRNVNKKLNSMSKVDSIVNEHPDLTLDDLVATRKINKDQKEQALKKPGLMSQVAQIEAQIEQHKKIDAEYQDRMKQEREQLQSTHNDEIRRRIEAVRAETEIEIQVESRKRLLMFSRFLKAAATRRQNEDDAETEEGKAFEGALLQVYGGDPAAVDAAMKLIDGSDENVPSVDGTLLSVTYKQVQGAAVKETDSPFAAEESWVQNVASSQPNPPESDPDTTSTTPANIPGTDPTVAHAGLTEIDTQVQIPTNGVNSAAENVEIPTAPAATSIDAGTGNAAAEEHWDEKGADPLAESFEIVPRPLEETDTPASATAPQPQARTQSWADETAAEQSQQQAPAATSAGNAAANVAAANGNGNDGFHEVHHRGTRGRGEHRGNRGGPRGRGDGRGRGGFRGDYRGGRGRGGGGQQGQFRGPRQDRQ